jgi:hypothetical protein
VESDKNNIEMLSKYCKEDEIDLFLIPISLPLLSKPVITNMVLKYSNDSCIDFDGILNRKIDDNMHPAIFINSETGSTSATNRVIIQSGSKSILKYFQKPSVNFHR